MTRTTSGIRGLRPRGREWVWALSAAGLALNGLRLRGRVEALTAIDPAPDGDAGRDRAERFTLFTVEGATVTDQGLADAVAHAQAHGLDLLELVPADLDPDRVLDVVRQVDPATYRDDRLAAGRGAAQAVLVDRELLDRLDARLPDRALDEADIAALTAEAKLFAPTGCDLAVSGGVRAAPEAPDRRRALLQAQHGGGAPIAVGFPLVGLAGLAAGAVAAPGWAALTAAAYCAQPHLALRGGPLGRGLSVRQAATRPLTSLRRAVLVADSAARPHGTLVGPEQVSDEVTRKQEAAARARYAEALAGGTDRFFDPRREDCPWCGSDDVAGLLSCTDVLQQKPGTFNLDRCTTCGHVFQNPALSLDGLDFYYGDFYDGVGADELEAVFASSATPYEGRADLVRRHVEGDGPAAWLDVGTGHGHFCLMARRTFPDTRFEGLDLGDAVLTAARRGWIDEAHQGLLPDVATDLAERFDVVSMHHYLEHTRDPSAELAAARTALRPGGHLLIEVPDPESRPGALLGKWWGPWFQPQHQHLMPLDNLCERLREEGFTVVDTERERAHQPIEASMAAWMVLSHLGPKVGQPWQPPASAAGTARRAAVFVAGAPAIAFGLVFDKLVGPVIGRMHGGSNAYRILARLPGESSVTAAPATASTAPATTVPATTAPATTAPIAPTTASPGAASPQATAPPSTGDRARRARRQRRTDADAADGLVPAPHPDPRTWQAGLLDQIAARTGPGVAYAQEPVALDHAMGPWAFGFELAPGSPGSAGWAGPLTVRLADDRAEIEREAAAIGASSSHGLRAPAVLGGIELDGGRLWALVTTRPTDPSLPDVIGRNLNDSDALLVGFADHHADLHDRTAGAPPSWVPVVDPAVEVERLDVTHDPRAVAWLRAHVPAPAGGTGDGDGGGPEAVLCHGGYQPLCVHSPGPDAWGDHGGPGRRLTVTNWCGAVVAEREYDVAFTLVAFWSSPFFAPSRAERTAVKMIRNTLANTYRQAYLRRYPLDPERLAFWQAFHALRGVARLDGAYDATGSPYAAVDRGPLPAPLRDQLARYADLVMAG